MPTNFRAISIITLIIIASIGAYFIWKHLTFSVQIKQIHYLPTTTSSSTTTTTTPQTPILIPQNTTQPTQTPTTLNEFFPNINFKNYTHIAASSIDDFNKEPFYIDSISKPYTQDPVYVNGKTYSDIAETLNDTYFEQHGWTSDTISYHKYELEGLSADGPCGGDHSYLKVINNTLVMATIETSLSLCDDPTSPTGSSPNPIGAYNFVFVSNPFDLSEY